jgi:hypothetical protein
MFDSKTLETIKTIDVSGKPDGILFEPATEKIYVLSHSAPNVTVINAADGTIAGTIDLGGAPEQGASDGKGHVYICVEDKGQVAVVDANTMTTTGHYDLGEKGGTPAGMAMDTANNILFVYCRKAQSCLVLNAADGKIIATLPTGSGCDAAEFNPKTMEAFSSQGNGTLTVIKENSPTGFAVELSCRGRLRLSWSANNADLALRHHSRERIRLRQHDQSDQDGQRQAVQENIAQDGAFFALLAGGGTGHDDALGIDHFAHHAPGAVGRCGQNRGDSDLLRRELLKISEEHIGRRVASRKGHSKPAQQWREERKRPPGVGKCQTHGGDQPRLFG